ncbi:MAG TPA: hypothetical protein VNO30_43385 [Kofleriaceae bacterium]|nr:hypothetical protein [Kofleriaceae bacterium]
MAPQRAVGVAADQLPATAPRLVEIATLGERLAALRLCDAAALAAMRRLLAQHSSTPRSPSPIRPRARRCSPAGLLATPLEALAPAAAALLREALKPRFLLRLGFAVFGGRGQRKHLATNLVVARGPDYPDLPP